MTHDFENAIGRLPPQNIEAEAAILGGIMLDPNALARVKDILRPEHFYLKAHSRIYEAALKLHFKEQPADLMVMISYLSDNDLLEIVGGRNKLVGLINQVVGAVNVELIYKFIQKQKLPIGPEFLISVRFNQLISLQAKHEQTNFEYISNSFLIQTLPQKI